MLFISTKTVDDKAVLVNTEFIQAAQQTEKGTKFFLKDQLMISTLYSYEDFLRELTEKKI